MATSVSSALHCVGDIVRIVYRQELTGFTVFEVRQVPPLVCPLVPLLFKSVYVSPVPLVIGARVELEGEWIPGKFGLQLKVTSLSLARRPSVEAALQYLQSGVVFGIGPALAKRIVSTFGVETMRILESDPERLLEVPGLGRHTVDHLMQVLQVRAGHAESVGALLQVGLTIGFAQRVLQHFGPQAADVVRDDPYRLSEVCGIGFLRADAIARGLGLVPESAPRIRAGLRYVLESESEKGHSCLPIQTLLDAAVDLLAISSPHVQAVLRAALADGMLRAFGTLVYLSRYYEAEREIERMVRILVQHPIVKAVPTLDVDGMLLTQAQHEAVRRALSYPLSIVTGLPGTGKTTVVTTMVREAESRGQRVALAAPTWQAAERLAAVTGSHAMTVHRLLEWNMKDAPRRDAVLPLDCDLLVVDEAPLEDLAVMAKLLAAIRPARTRVVLVGDVHQLPSVGCGQVMKDLIRSNLCPVTQLLEIQRQACDSTIITLSHDVHYGRVKGLRSGTIGDCEFHFETAGALEIRRRLLTRLSSLYDEFDDVQVLSPMHKGPLGTLELNRAIQQLRYPDEVESVGGFVRGDRVRVVMRDEGLGITKGESGTVVSCDASSREVSVRLADRVIVFDEQTYDRLSLAYCMTVHRAQGSQYACVVLVLDVSQYVMLQRAVLYTGMTRAAQRFVFIGNPKAFYLAVKNQSMTDRCSGLFLESGSSSVYVPSFLSARA